MKIKEIFRGLRIRLEPGLKDIEITSIETDSNKVKKGSLFIALKGLRHNGHNFVGSAFKNGAAAVLIARDKYRDLDDKRLIRAGDTRRALSVTANNFYRFPSKKIKIIGITGTNGKTTTSLLIESIFNIAGAPCGVIGTISYRTGKDHFAASHTTPDPVLINSLLRRMSDSGLKTAVMEVSSHALDQERVAGLLFDTAIFTNLTHEHLDYHGDLEHYFQSKAKLFSSVKKSGLCIINSDDPWSGRLMRNLKGRPVMTYGLKKKADIKAVIRELSVDGSRFLIKTKDGAKITLKTKLIGLHNIYNILAAVSAGISHKIDLEEIKRGIEEIGSIPGRLEPVRAGQKFKILVDYAHTQNALENVLRFLKAVKKGRIITVFGCGGDRDKTKRPLMGKVAQRLSDILIITNDNPRTEDPAMIIRDIKRGIDKEKKNYFIIPDRRRAIKKALGRAEEADIVLIAGKGHEKYQLVAESKIPFDDRKVAILALRRL